MEWEKTFANDVTRRGLIYWNMQVTHTTQQQKSKPSY